MRALMCLGQAMASTTAIIALGFCQRIVISTAASNYNFDSCESLVVAGGGPGGLYAAWRMIETEIADASRTCIFEQGQRVGGRMRSVRGDELPEELSEIGSEAIDVGAYRARPVLHPFTAGLWKTLDVESGCYSDISFRTGDCTDECDPARAVHKYLRDKYIPYADTLNSTGLPYNLGPYNVWNVSGTYLSPYDWVYGAYAPSFWAENFDDMAYNEDAAVRFAARDRVVEASRTFEINGTPSTIFTPRWLALTGYNSDGIYMTKEDFDFYVDNDCSTGEHVLTMISYHDTVVEYANYFANGLDLDLGGDHMTPVTEDGKQLGYDIVNPLMLEKLEELGATIYYGFQVTRTRPKKWREGWAQVSVLDLSEDTEYSFDAEHVVLNVPTEFIRTILSDNTIEAYGRSDLFDVFRAVQTLGLFKAYPYYPEAWWAKLGYTSGRLKTTLDIYHSRFHDGYTQCDDEGDYENNCSGVFLGTYIQGWQRGQQWAQQYFPPRGYVESSDGLYIVRRGEGLPEQDDWLDELHAQNMESNRDVLAESGIDADSIAAPDLCLVGEWLGAIAGAHLRTSSHLSAGAIDEAAVEPFPGYNIHLVNEAYGIPAGWLQASLYTAERMMYHYYGKEKPEWFDDDIFDGFDADAYYDSVVKNSNGDGK